jgi:CRP-like cAMP-binding protein
VAASRLGHGLGPGQLQVLASALQLQQHAAGAVLAAEGTADGRLWNLVDGRLSVVKHLGQDDEQLLVTLQAGDFAHELGFLDGTERYASLVAATPVQVLVMERTALEGLVDTHPRIVYAVMCAILRAVHDVQTRLAVQASELTNYVVKQHGRY